MRKTLKIFAAVMCLLFALSSIAFADEAYEKKIAELYRLSEKATEFMKAHNVDFSIFDGAEVYPEDHPVNYSRSIESLIMQAEAYGFSDEQISAYIRGVVNSKPTIIGGKYDNTGRKQVIVPEYPFVINGLDIDYKNSLYPVISYNDITYFPMTWHYCRMLGVATEWNEETGLYITKQETSAEQPQYEEAFNESILYAVIPKYDIYVNGNKIDNEGEEYPLLNFRNVTYFPMTWAFMVDEFGWNYSFDSENGLIVNSTEDSSDIHTEKLENFRVIGYYSGDLFDEPLSSLQTDKLTHIMYAFLIPQADGTCLPLENSEKVKNLVQQAHSDGCRVYIAVGGWSHKDVPLVTTFENVAADDTLRKKLVQSILSVVEKYGFDGVELDWEYPSSASQQNYESLILELSAELEKSGKYLTAALNGAWSATEGPEVSNYVSQACLDAFEFINVMSYDMNNEQHSPFWFANTSIDYWLTRGVAAEKIVLGMPLYARPTWMQYRHLVAANSQAAYSDSISIDGKVSYYNGLPTLCKKTVLAAHKAGGVMLFDVNEDTNDSHSVVSMIDDVIKQIKANGTLSDETVKFLNENGGTEELTNIIG